MKNLLAKKKKKKIVSSQTARFEGKKKKGVAMSFKANKLSRNVLKICSTGKILIHT